MVNMATKKVNITLNSNNLEQFNKKIKSILNSNKRPWEKKLALFNLVKSLEIEESPEEEKRVNYLLESCLLNDLAKHSMKEYKKATAESFSRIH